MKPKKLLGADNKTIEEQLLDLISKSDESPDKVFQALNNCAGTLRNLEKVKNSNTKTSELFIK